MYPLTHTPKLALASSAKKVVAAYKHTDVTKYKDLLGLFELAENTFGGVDVSFFLRELLCVP